MYHEGILGPTIVKAHFESYGCSLSYGEAEMMRRMALGKGWNIVDAPEDADLVVITTCIVIQSTEARMSHRLKVLSAFGKPLVVYGCMPKAMEEKVRRLAPGATLLMPEELEAFGGLIERVGPERPVGNGAVHSNIPIANGCRGQCAYCVTRLARKDLRSRSVDDIVDHVLQELALGRKEIRLTAQDTAVYGVDMGAGGRSLLPELIEAVASLEGDHRTRVGMMNPNSLEAILEPVIEALNHPKVFKFLHLPIQSGSDEVLARMGRGYSVVDYVRVLERMRKGVPGISLSTDIIAGFPGETEEDFRRTVDVLERIRPDVVNLKGFSARPGTPAKSMPGRVDTKVVKDRTRMLTGIRKAIALGNLSRMEGTETEVLLTERHRPGNTMGRTASYRPIAVSGELPLGTFVRARVTGARTSHLIGRAVR